MAGFFDLLLSVLSGVFVFLGSVVDLSWWLLVALWMVGVLVVSGIRWVFLWIRDFAGRARRASAHADRDDFLF